MKKFTKEQIEQRDQARDVCLLTLLGVKVNQGIPCPICGGDDRFNVDRDNRWWCRICKPGKPGQDSITLIMERDNLKFTEAVAFLINSPATSTPAKPNKPRQPEPLQNFIRTCKVQRDALLTDAAVLAYATGRGLTQDTLKRFGCGAYNHYGRMALSFPYVTEDRLSIPAVRLRLIQTNDKRSIADSRYVLPFGLQALTGRSSLVIVEGEINAMSIAQSADVDALSFGSESIRTDSPQFKIICDVAKRYERVMIWCDKPEVSQRLGRAIARADLRQSPNGNDANDLLQRGLLAQFLDRVLPTDRPQIGDILRTKDGREITVHDISGDFVAGLDSGVLDPFHAKPYRLINGIAHEADGVTGRVAL